MRNANLKIKTTAAGSADISRGNTFVGHVYLADEIVNERGQTVTAAGWVPVSRGRGSWADPPLFPRYRTRREAAESLAPSNYTVVRRETPGAHLTGREPVVEARHPNADAALLIRCSDDRRFLLIGATTDERQARAWADRQLETEEDDPVTITDIYGTSGSTTADKDNVADAIQAWYVGAPQDVIDAVADLQAALDRGDYTGDLEALLGITIDYREDA